MAFFCYHISMKTQKYIQQIKNEFPKLHWTNFKINTTGWDFIVIVLDNKLIFRFPRDNQDKISLKKEILFLQYFEKKCRVNIPAYEYIAKDYSFAGYKIINGSSLKKWRYDKLTQKQKKILTQQISGVLTDLHSINILKIKNINLNKSQPDKIYQSLIFQSNKYLFPKLNQKEKDLINCHFKELKKYTANKYKNAIVHGDLSSDHII